MDKLAEIFDEVLLYMVSYPITMFNLIFFPGLVFGDQISPTHCPASVCFVLGVILFFLGNRLKLSISVPDFDVKPTVEKADLDSDIKRRDFTINTLAYGLNKDNYGKIIDKLDGKKDLENKIIKTPLDPVETFKDDPLRIMRAVRFASQLDFEIEKETYIAIEKNVKRLEIISMERIRDEFLKIIQSQVPSVGLWHLFNTGILKKIIPELAHLYGIEEIEVYISDE